MRLLLVEDDAMIGASIRHGLNRVGHAVDWVRDGVAGELAADSDAYEVILLDIGLPRKSGLDVLERLRRRRKRTPVLILSARDAQPVVTNFQRSDSRLCDRNGAVERTRVNILPHTQAK